MSTEHTKALLENCCKPFEDALLRADAEFQGIAKYLPEAVALAAVALRAWVGQRLEQLEKKYPVVAKSAAAAAVPVVADVAVVVAPPVAPAPAPAAAAMAAVSAVAPSAPQEKKSKKRKTPPTKEPKPRVPAPVAAAAAAPAPAPAAAAAAAAPPAPAPAPAPAAAAAAAAPPAPARAAAAAAAVAESSDDEQKKQKKVRRPRMTDEEKKERAEKKKQEKQALAEAKREERKKEKEAAAKKIAANAAAVKANVERFKAMSDAERKAVCEEQKKAKASAAVAPKRVKPAIAAAAAAAADSMSDDPVETGDDEDGDEDEDEDDDGDSDDVTTLDDAEYKQFWKPFEKKKNKCHNCNTKDAVKPCTACMDKWLCSDEECRRNHQKSFGCLRRSDTEYTHSVMVAFSTRNPDVPIDHRPFYPEPPAGTNPNSCFVCETPVGGTRCSLCTQPCLCKRPACAIAHQAGATCKALSLNARVIEFRDKLAKGQGGGLIASEILTRQQFMDSVEKPKPQHARFRAEAIAEVAHRD